MDMAHRERATGRCYVRRGRPALSKRSCRLGLRWCCSRSERKRSVNAALSPCRSASARRSLRVRRRSARGRRPRSHRVRGGTGARAAPGPCCPPRRRPGPGARRRTTPVASSHPRQAASSARPATAACRSAVRPPAAARRSRRLGSRSRSAHARPAVAGIGGQCLPDHAAAELQQPGPQDCLGRTQAALAAAQ